MSTPILTPAELERLRSALPALTQVYDAAAPASPIVQKFAALGRDQLTRLITERRSLAGEVIFQEGTAGDAMYIVWSGLVVVFKGDFRSPTFLGYRGPGEVIGEMALVDDQPRSASGVMLKDGRLLRISRENFQQLVQHHPDVGMSILKVISARLRVSDSARRITALQAGQLAGQVSQLQAEKQQLLELQRLREETSNLIIHDLRNPLTSILSSLQLLLMVLPEEALQPNRELLDIAQASCNRMLLLVNTLLDVARMEAGEMALELVSLRLSDLVAAVVHRVPAFASGEVKLAVAVPETLPAVMADLDRLDRVLINLIDNALKYTPVGPEGKITVAAEVHGAQMLVSVTDTGPGVPPEERERIFDRFTQTASEKHQRRGFGLGLAFCRLTVEAHGGKIWVESGAGGVGSRFVFTLPLEAPAAPQ